MSQTQNHIYAGGLDNAPVDAAHAFRVLMTVLARPGTIETLGGGQGPAPLSMAASITLLTLCDGDTVLHLAGEHDTAAIRDWITFHIGAPFGTAQEADFVVGAWDAVLPLTQYRIGTPEYPDQSATLIVEVETLSHSGATLSGPGIQTQSELPLPAIPPLQDNAALYPLGLDFYWTCGAQIAALPRSTQINAEARPCM